MTSLAPELSLLVERVYRQEYGKVLAVIMRHCAGDLQLAQDACAEAFARALVRWQTTRIPDNPAAWLTQVARNWICDRQREAQVRAAKHVLWQPQVQLPPIDAIDAFELEEANEPAPIPDERLTLIFTCCHPALDPDAQIALTLRTLGGLSTEEIARAFVVPVPTMAQRLVRAKNKIKGAKIPYEVPDRHSLPERLAGVLHTLYLIFNEGYRATQGDELLRVDLCARAIELGRACWSLLPQAPEVGGMLALMLFHHARRDSRIDASGDLVVLEEQDRQRWHRQEIAQANEILNQALAQRSLGVYQIQAAIAGVHTSADHPQHTDWPQILGLYDRLLSYEDTPIVRLNRAVALAMVHGPRCGIEALDELAAQGRLSHYHLLPAAQAELWRRLGATEKARDYYEQALVMVKNLSEKRYLLRRLGDSG